MEVFNLDIIPGKSAPVIHASQFDAGREFKANLFEGPTVYTLSGAETLSVIVRKPDGNMVTAAVTNTSDSYITFETTEQMTACDGANLCELRIENGADAIGSINFIMEVEKSPDTGITSASEIHNLEAQVDAFTAIAVADQYDSANVIFDNTPTPGHGNGYAVTSEGVATALSTKADASSVPTDLDDLNDVTIATPTNGQILAYNGSKWVNNNALLDAKADKAITDLTPDYKHANITTNGMNFHRFGKMLFFSGYFTGSGVPRYTEIFRLNGLSCATTFVPLVAVNNGYGYMEIYTSAQGVSFRISNLPADVSTNTVFSGCVKLV